MRKPSALIYGGNRSPAFARTLVDHPQKAVEQPENAGHIAMLHASADLHGRMIGQQLIAWRTMIDELLRGAGLAQRVKIVLLASYGIANVWIVTEVGKTTTSVWKWRNRYIEAGLAGLADAPRAGRPKRVDDERIITATLTVPPKKYGVTHWSSRLLAGHLKIGNATVARAWRKYGVQPWRSETFKFSTDPELVGKVTDVVGLYLAPPENAIWTVPGLVDTGEVCGSR